MKVKRPIPQTVQTNPNPTPPSDNLENVASSGKQSVRDEPELQLEIHSMQNRLDGVASRKKVDFSVSGISTVGNTYDTVDQLRNVSFNSKGTAAIQERVISNQNLTKVDNLEMFQNFIDKDEQPILIDFYTDWCPPCKYISPFFEEYST